MVYLAVVGNTAESPGPSSGQENFAAAQWATERFNAADRLDGYKLEMVYFDDEGDPDRAVAVANEIVTDGRFLGVIGHQTTATSEAARPVYEAARIPAITASATGDGVTQGDAWYFRTIFDNFPNWGANAVNFYPMSVGNTSALGDPTTISGPAGVTYSQVVTDITISRDVSSFLVKNILPLALLVVVTFLSLWLPISESARISFAVTEILTGAVMLNSVTGSLASVEYTVAIEWAYYAFIALSGIILLLTLIGRHLQEQRRLASLRKLVTFSRIFFVVYVAMTTLAYVIAFA